MFDPERWAARVAGTDCSMCGAQNTEMLVAEMPSGSLILQNDGDFVGYCILIHRRHVTELFELDAQERQQFIEDVTSVAQVLADRFRPAKINYAVLGNEVPHLHCHIIPRKPDDGYWGGPIWSRPSDLQRALPPDEYATLRDDLRAALINSHHAGKLVLE